MMPKHGTKRTVKRVGSDTRSILTETCDDETPNLITQVTTTPATTDDSLVTATIQSALAAKALLPAEHYADRGYTSAALLVSSQQNHGIHVVGPVQGDAQWQAQTPDGLTIAQFAIDWEAQQVVCPAGKMSSKWQPYMDGQQQEIMVQFARKDCTECALQRVCTRAKTAGQQLTLHPREQHIALQNARRWQESEDFKALYASGWGRRNIQSKAIAAVTCVMPAISGRQRPICKTSSQRSRSTYCGCSLGLRRNRVP